MSYNITCELEKIHHATVARLQIGGYTCYLTRDDLAKLNSLTFTAVKRIDHETGKDK